jgi:hypothetical protein
MRHLQPINTPTMMKTSLLTCLLSLPLFISAQNFPDTWTYGLFGFGFESEGPSHIEKIQELTINGLDCIEIEMPYPDLITVTYLCQDGQKVYRLGPADEPYLLYDFGLDIEDTLHIPLQHLTPENFDDTLSYIIAAKHTIEWEGMELIQQSIFMIGDMEPYFYFGETLTEKVGSHEYYFPYLGFSELGFSFRCAEFGGVGVYKEVDYPCDTTFFLTSDHEVDHIEDWEVFPNPTQDLIRIDLEQASENTYNIQVMDTQGKVLVQLQQSLPTQVSLGDLPAGIYFLDVRDEQGTLLFQEKVVRQE